MTWAKIGASTHRSLPFIYLIYRELRKNDCAHTHKYCQFHHKKIHENYYSDHHNHGKVTCSKMKYGINIKVWNSEMLNAFKQRLLALCSLVKEKQYPPSFLQSRCLLNPKQKQQCLDPSPALFIKALWTFFPLTVFSCRSFRGKLHMSSYKHAIGWQHL